MEPLFFECDLCIKKTLSSGCFDCHISRLKQSLEKFQKSIDNIKDKNHIIVGNKFYKPYIEKYIDFKNRDYIITPYLPTIYLGVIINKQFFNTRDIKIADDWSELL